MSDAIMLHVFTRSMSSALPVMMGKLEALEGDIWTAAHHFQRQFYDFHVPSALHTMMGFAESALPIWSAIFFGIILGWSWRPRYFMRMET